MRRQKKYAVVNNGRNRNRSKSGSRQHLLVPSGLQYPEYASFSADIYFSVDDDRGGAPDATFKLVLPETFARLGIEAMQPAGIIRDIGEPLINRYIDDSAVDLLAGPYLFSRRRIQAGEHSLARTVNGALADRNVYRAFVHYRSGDHLARPDRALVLPLGVGNFLTVSLSIFRRIAIVPPDSLEGLRLLACL